MQVLYRLRDAHPSNDHSADGCSARSRPSRIGRSVRIIAVLLVVATLARAASTLLGLPITDPAARDVVEGYTLSRQLKTMRFIGTLRATDWMMDRPAFAATLARHLHPPLEPYHVKDKGNGVYEVDDQGALRGTVRLMTRGTERRVYFVEEGQFRSLAHILMLSGSMVFALAYRERREGDESYVEVDPQLFLRLDNVMIHGIGKVLAPILHGIIDRRVAKLTDAARIVSQRLTKDPAGLYREMQTWPDVRPEELTEYRQAFRITPDVAKDGK
jgi:hypothetical protein